MHQAQRRPTRPSVRFGLILAFALSVGLARPSAAQTPMPAICGGTPIQWATQMAQSATARLGDTLLYGHPRATLDYSNDLFALSLISLAKHTGDTSFRDYGEAIVASHINHDGTIKDIPANGFRLDAMPAGLVMIELYKRTGQREYRIAADYMRHRLSELPRTTAGTFAWAPGQIWLDGIWMTEPFYARYAKTFDQPADFNDILSQYQQVAIHNRDPGTGLYYHGWDEYHLQPWANPRTGTSASFWGRSIGWFAMSLVDTLDSVPPHDPLHAYLLRLINDLAPALAHAQDPESGLWWEVVDQGGKPGNYTESSASAMFVTMLAKAINRGYLSTGYTQVALRGFAGLIHDKVVKDDQGRWSLTSIVRSAGLGTPPAVWPPGASPSPRDATPGGRDGSFDYYVGQPVTSDNLHGLGPFIMAGIQINALPPETLQTEHDTPCRYRLP